MINPARAVALGLCAGATVALSAGAQQIDQTNIRTTTGTSADASTRPKVGAATDDLIHQPLPGLEPRQPLPKRPTAQLQPPESWTGRVIVKFMDHVHARPTEDGAVESLVRQNVNEANDIVEMFDVELSPSINKPTETLYEIQSRAEANSGRAQPDLAGMMYLDGGPANLVAAAQTLNELDLIEWVQFEQVGRTFQAPEECGDGGPCTAVANEPYCTDEQCCELIITFDPYCEEVAWDDLCVASANLYCQPPTDYDRCATPTNGGCFEVDVLAGCNNEDCCNTVCGIDDFCCTFRWDEFCVELARENCNTLPDVNTTPDFLGLQGYLTQEPYDRATLPPELADLLPLTAAGDPFPGLGGEGWFLDDPDDEYAGLYGLGQELLEVYGVDQMDMGNMTRGKAVKVGVIEWGMYQYHEDLDVTVEPGQTLITRADVTEPDHATSCMGIINAQDNDFGVTGIAPDADAYFFPLTSVEEGPRESSAWISMMETFGPGDVVSCSYGPFPNLNCVESSWMLIRLATDLGITVCVAAGNDCFNIDEAADLTDSGAFVVGAMSPGFPYYRLSFSNYHEEGVMGENGNMVHVSAWGERVTSTGSGFLWRGEGQGHNGDDDADNHVADDAAGHNRAYTQSFNGTSAATPQIAGLAACLQGLAKQFYGVPLSPDHMRTVITSGVIPKGYYNPRFTGGFPDDVVCALDYDPDEDPHLVGGYPIAAGMFGSVSSRLLNTHGFDDSPLLDDITVIRGSLVLGNAFSVKGSDNNYLVVESRRASRGERGGEGFDGGNVGRPGFGEYPASQVVYPSTGQYTDLLIESTSDIANVARVGVDVEYQQTFNPTIMFIEGYDWISKRWTFMGFDFTVGGGPVEDDDGEVVDPTANGFINGGGQRFVRESDRGILCRIWTLQFPGASSGGFGQVAGIEQGGRFRYQMLYDLIDVDVSRRFGQGQ